VSRLLLAVAALLLLFVAATLVLCGLVLFTERGTGLVIDEALERYDAMVPGGVELRQRSGVLGGRLRLEGLRLTDRGGRELVALEALTLDWQPAVLLQRELRVAELTVERPTLRLWSGGERDPLLDLAPEPSDSDEPPPPAPPPAPLELPALPLGLKVVLRVHDARVIQHNLAPVAGDCAPAASAEERSAGQGQELLRGASVAVELGGRGDQARVVVQQGALEVPPAGLSVSELRCRLRRRGGRLAVEDLVVRSSLGDVSLPSATWSLESGAGELLASVEAPADALAALAGVPLGAGVRVRARAGGDLDGLVLQASVEFPRVGRVGSAGRVEALVQADLRPHPAARIEVLALDLDPSAFGAPAGVSLGAEVLLRVALPGASLATLPTVGPADLCADLRLRCRGCRVAPVGPLRASLRAQVLAGTAELHAEGAAAGATVGLQALLADLAALQAPDAAPQDLRWRLSVPDLGASATVVGVDDVQGTLQASGACRGRLHELRCSGGVQLERVAGFGASLQHADLTLEARPTASPPSLRATLELSDVRAPGLPGSLAATVRAHGDTRRLVVALDGRRRPGETLALEAALQPGPPVVVDLLSLRGRALGEQVLLLEPARVRRVGERIELDLLRLGALGAVVRAQGVFDPAGQSDLRGGVAGLDLARVARLEPRLQASGVLSMGGRLRGTLAAPRAEMELTGRDLAWQALAVGDLEVSARYAGGRGHGQVQLGGSPAGPRLEAEASLPLVVDLAAGRVEPNFKGRHQVRWTLTDLRSEWISTLQPLPKGAAFQLASEGAFQGPIAALAGEASLSGPVRAPGFAASELDAALRLAPGSQEARILLSLPSPLGREEPLTVGASAAASPEAQPPAAPSAASPEAQPPAAPSAASPEAQPPAAPSAARVAERAPAGPPLATEPLKVVVRAQADLSGLPQRPPDPFGVPFVAQVAVPRVDLAGLAPLLPDMLFRPAGHLSATIDASGTAKEPRVAGKVTLADGGISVVPLGGRIEHATLDLRLAHTGVDLRQLTFRSGKGKGSVRGEVVVQPNGAADGRIDLRLERFPLHAPGAPRARLDSRVQVGLQRSAPDGALDVDVKVRETVMRITARRSRALDAIPHNPNVVFVDAAVPQPAKPTREQGRTPASAAPPIHVKVKLVDPVSLRAPFLDMRWGGGLDAGLRDGKLAVSGGLVAERSAFDLIGNRFEVESGEVTIAEGERVEPYLQLVAHADTPEARVTATIRGPASAPELVLSSEPPLPQYQILTLLVTGSTQSSEEGGEQVRSKAAALLAAFQSPALERQLHDRVGIDRARVSFGDSADQPILVLGKFLTRWMYLETRYHHNAPEDVNARELRLELRLGRRWSLETLYGDAAIGGMDVFWRPPLAPRRATSAPPRP